jgi:hypothetical protein
MAVMDLYETSDNIINLHEISSGNVLDDEVPEKRGHPPPSSIRTPVLPIFVMSHGIPVEFFTWRLVRDVHRKQ